MHRGILRYRNRTFVIPPGLTLVGRHRDCAFQLDDPSVSRQHALLFSEDGVYTLMDYKSSNGITVNGVRIFRAALRPGDEILIGEASCEFALEAELSGTWKQTFENFDGAFLVRPYSQVLKRSERLGMVQRKRDFQFLVEAAMDLRDANSVRDVGIRLLHAALTGLEAGRGFLAIGEGQGRSKVVTTVGIAPEKIQSIEFFLAMTSRAQASRVLVRTTPNFADFVHHEPRLIFEDIGSALACPLLGSKGVLGAFYIERTQVEDPFVNTDEEPLALLAHGVALTLEAVLWREEIELSLGGLEFLGPGSQAIFVNCGVCGEAAEPEDREVVVCDACNAVHHRDCWEYNHGCARYACGSNASRSLRFRLEDLAGQDLPAR